MRWCSYIGLWLIGLWLAGGASAASISVSVTAVDGTPVHDAIVVAEPVAAPAAATKAAPATAVVDQRGKEFHPWVSAVLVGTRVIFDNHDDITHHVYSFSTPKRFSFRLQAGQQHAPLIFDKPGVVIVGCNIHDWMVAYIYVSDSPYFARTDTRGRARIDHLPAGKWRVVLWHPGIVDGSAYTQSIAVNGSDDRAVSIRLRAPLTVTGPRPPLDNIGYP